MAFYLSLQSIGKKFEPMVMNCKTTKDICVFFTFERKIDSNIVFTLM